MSYTLIEISNAGEVFPGYNFKNNEFHPNAKNSLPDQSGFPREYYLSTAVIKGGQVLRSHYGKPVRVNSAGRTKSHNASEGGSQKSQHLLGQYRGAQTDHVEASDFDWFNKPYEKEFLKDLHYQMINGGPLRDKLQEAGITTVGLYDNFVHLDDRAGSWKIFDYRASTKGDEMPLTGQWKQFVDALTNPGDDGLMDFTIGAKKKGPQILLALLAIAILIIVAKRRNWI